MPDLAHVLARFAREIEEGRRRDRGRSREGRVAQVDEAKGLYRVDIGREGNEFLTPWIPVEALSSGALAIQAEPVVGQHVKVTSESGDLTDALITLSSFDNANPRPHGKAGQLKVVVGGTAITGTADELVFESNGTSVTLSSAGMAVSGPGLTHNGTDVGETHKHSGVQSGPDTTGTPT